METPIMGSSPNTLHDFVLDLLSNPTALADFQADAEGALAAAGLSDISALDVQEVLPLVLDYAPAGTLPALDGALPADLPAADLDADDAIGRLQAVAQTLAAAPGSSDVNSAAAGALSTNGVSVFGGFSDWGFGEAPRSADATLADDFSAVGDVTGALDDALPTATGPVTDLAGAPSDVPGGALAGGATDALPDAHGLTSQVFGAVDTLDGVVDGVTGGLAGQLPGTVPDAGRAVDVLDPVELPDPGIAPETTVGTVEDTTGIAVSDVTSHVPATDAPLLGLGATNLPVVDDLLF
ncbi:IniB N-terminal domain-containing protein [Saccharothrix obliqua]|uniref:IniB N-terminal domain-containing protein n=1 Tax=Saccharothrix obliqua TaxID=2861747 RepID=UPI001C606480|nr:IniB N-terminal domain-containing protein [Saccharothrix obliqua]MBW4719048.1 IniB N-terminal domain-containing protein [Saccharothrix obliqua]